MKKICGNEVSEAFKLRSFSGLEASFELAVTGIETTTNLLI